MLGLIAIMAIVASVTSVLLAVLCYFITKNDNFKYSTFILMILFFTVGGIYVINQNTTSVSSKTYHLVLNSEGHTQYSTETNDDSDFDVDTSYTFKTSSGQSIKVDGPSKITYNQTNQSKLVQTKYAEHLKLFGHTFNIDSYTKSHIYIIK